MNGLAACRPCPPALNDACALFLDVDGSLIEFAPTPDRVHVPPTLRHRLFLLGETLHGALALVSGRSVDALDALFWPLKLPAAGLHGNELRTRDGFVRKSEPCEALPRIHAEAVALSMRHPGTLIENKGAGIALHWREAPDAAPMLQAFAEASLQRLPGYRLQAGHCVLELLKGHADKGQAIQDLLETSPFHGRLPIFAGDDLTDESGFNAVNAAGGISILIGARGNSAARYSLSNPAALRAWLGVTHHEGSA